MPVELSGSVGSVLEVSVGSLSVVVSPVLGVMADVVEDAYTAGFMAYRSKYLFTADEAGRMTARHRLEERDDVPATPVLVEGFRYDAGDRLLAIEAGPASGANVCCSRRPRQLRGGRPRNPSSVGQDV